jgi:hypothetical protein
VAHRRRGSEGKASGGAGVRLVAGRAEARQRQDGRCEASGRAGSGAAGRMRPMSGRAAVRLVAAATPGCSMTIGRGSLSPQVSRAQ